MFPSRIREGAKPLGYAVRIAPTEKAAMEGATTAPPIAILVNLTARRYDPLAIITALKGDERTRAIPLLAFAGHVEREKHQAAREAGADLVAANSSVSLHLGAVLNRLLSPPTGNETDDALEIEENQ